MVFTGDQEARRRSTLDLLISCSLLPISDGRRPSAIIAPLMSAAAPWLSPPDPGAPATLAPYPDRTLVDYLRDAVREQPSAPAVLFKGATLTFADLDAVSDCCA